MRNIILFISTIMLLNISCSDLDVDPRDRYSNEIVWKNITNLDLYVNHLYSKTIYHHSEIGGTNLSDGYSDILKYSLTYEGHHNRMALMPNYLSPQNTGALSSWGESYEAIKILNEFIINANKYGGNLEKTEVDTRLAEARFLRAFMYHKLIIRHGGIVLRVSDEVLDGPNEKNKERASTEESWDWVMSELNAIENQLPEKWDDKNVGRITKGALYALMARSALYAERWDNAITAAKKVEAMAEEKQLYGLMESFDKIYDTPHNKEIILGAYYKRPELTNEFDRYFSPTGDITHYGGYASPTEELVSQFDINTGSGWESFDWNNPEHSASPYANREPRFYATILYNGAPWKGRTIETFKDGADGAIEYYFGNGQPKTVTGYFMRKFLEEKVKDFVQEKGDQYWIEFRYAEILTILSEAYARKDNFSQAYRYINMIRNRVSLPDLPQQNTWKAYYQDLQKEKVCEFAFEGHRYWDLRRWKTAPSVLDGMRMHGVSVTKNDDGTFSYQVIDCDKEDRYFPEKYLVVPIPDFETRNNTLCKQDPMWQ